MALSSDFPVKYIISTGKENARVLLKIIYFVKKKEVIGMWSEALRILDENSLKYYVEELDKKDAELSKKDEDLNRKDAEIAALKAQLAKR